jgi:phosphoribosylglycinamide formyltransferase-1
MSEEFVSEQIEPVAGTSHTTAMSRGEPGLPGRFVWRGKEYTVIEMLQSWKQSGPCKSGGGEVYLRKHWFKIKTTDGLEMTIYFERQPRSKQQSKKRWWLYTISAEV